MDVFNVEYFKKLIPTSSVKSVKELSGLVSSSRLFIIESDDKMMFARKSAGYYGPKAWQIEMRFSQYASLHQLSPKILAIDENSLLSVFEYVNDVGCLELYKTQPQETKKRMMGLARAIHRLQIKSFMKPRNILEEIKRVIEKIPQNFFDSDIKNIFAHILAICWPTDRAAVTHFDFHPKNILYDGKKFWMIDWEIGALGHPFFDIAVMSNFLFLDVDEGVDLLCCYLDAPATIDEIKTYHNLRKISYAFLASMNFLTAASDPQKAKNSDGKLSLSFDNIFTVWAQATQKNNLAINYQLGLFFIRHCEKF